MIDDYKCCILNCEYNSNGICNYCGDLWTLNNEDCLSFIDKDEE